MYRILVVEDSRTQAEAARAILEGAGYEVDVASSGEEALAFFDHDECDLIISDIMMPGMSGYDLCRHLKKDERTRATPVVLLTTLTDPMDIIQGLESGADNFVTKPYDPEYLIERVNTLLENRMLRAVGKLKVGVEIMFLGKKFVVSTDREQILDLLIATFEDVVRANRALQQAQHEVSDAKEKLEEYALALEGRVRTSEERYRALMHQAHDAILVVDVAGIIQSANARAEQLYGPAQAVIGSHVVDVIGIYPSTFERLLTVRELERSSVEHVSPDGELRILDYSASVTASGDEDLVLVIARDVTEQKELERRFHQSQKLEAVARLASGAAHDFNNILMAIQTFGDLMMRQIPADQERARASLEQIRKATRRGAWLTGQLLVFARGNVREFAEVDVNQVIRNLQPMLAQLIGEGIELDLRLSDVDAPVALEAGHIEQIVMNLVVNARDAMRSGGNITIETELVDLEPLEEAGRSGGPHSRIFVRDTGEGMSEEVASRLFNPFFTTKRSGRGSGLGLSIVEAIVTQAGGRIDVQSAPGEGTTFAISIPLLGQEMMPENPEDDSMAGGEACVLLLHNDASLRSLLRELLISRGYGVQEFSSASEIAPEGKRARADAVVSEASAERIRSVLGRDEQEIPIIEVPGLGGTAAMPYGSLSPDAILSELRSRLRNGR